MTLTLDLPAALEQRLRAAAEEDGVAPEDFTLSLLERTLPEPPAPITGADVVRRWKETGVIGAWADREDIGDSSEFARKLREEAQTRKRD